jgi:hypothetical protein
VTLQRCAHTAERRPNEFEWQPDGPRCGGHWYFQWFTVLFVAVTVAAGAAYRAYGRRPATSAEAAEPVESVA